MTEFDADPLEGHDSSTDLDQRDVRALTELLTVVPDGPGLYLVVSQSEATYMVDARAGRCDCPDARYNLADDEACKHERRVAFETGARPVPAWIEAGALPHDFAEHVEAEPVVAVADGGVIDAEPEPDAGDEQERPDDCACDELPANSLACWHCWQAGIQTTPSREGDDA